MQNAHNIDSDENHEQKSNLFLLVLFTAASFTFFRHSSWNWGEYSKKLDFPLHTQTRSFQSISRQLTVLVLTTKVRQARQNTQQKT